MPDTPPIKYTRLPGSGLSRKGSSFIAVARISNRLWLGEDHLLQVESAGGYNENYKRFYFRDIQAIYVRKTANWFGANVALGVLTGLFLLWTLSVKNGGGAITLGIFTVAFGFFLLLSVLRGPSCACHLKTAVHLEELPSLGRLRNANKVLALLRPLIAAAQGDLTSETAGQQYDGLLAKADAVAASASSTGQVTRVTDANIRAYDSRAHQILFYIVLADAFTDVLNIFLPSMPVVLLGALTGAAMAGAVLIALVKQHETDLKPPVRFVTWFTAAVTGVSYIAGYVILVMLVPQAQTEGTEWGMLKGLAALRPLESPGLLAVLVVGAALDAVLGLAGLLLLGQHRREKAAAV
jgi:hypothetical protein